MLLQIFYIVTRSHILYNPWKFRPFTTTSTVHIHADSVVLSSFGNFSFTCHSFETGSAIANSLQRLKGRLIPCNLWKCSGSATTSTVDINGWMSTSYTLQWDGYLPHPVSPIPVGGSGPMSNTMLHRSLVVLTPNGTSGDSPVKLRKNIGITGALRTQALHNAPLAMR